MRVRVVRKVLPIAILRCLQLLALLLLLELLLSVVPGHSIERPFPAAFLSEIRIRRHRRRSRVVVVIRFQYNSHFG